MSDPGRPPRPSPARRLAAVVALLAPLAMLAAVVVALVNRPLALLGALALVVLATSALWVAVTRRGARRAGAGIVVALAVGGVVALFATHARGILWLLGLGLLLALFGVTARYALHGIRRGPGALRPVRAARRGALIINPKSGGGKAERFDLVGECERRGIRPIVLRRGDDLLALARDAIADGVDVIGMAGGDGSQALVATIAMEHDVPHVCIPSGTRNHFALDLGLDRNDVVGALDAYDDAFERTIDLARVNDRVFVNNASLGVYAKVVQSDEYRDAKLETWGGMLPDLLGPNAPPLDLRFVGPDGSEHGDAPMILVSNNAYQLTRLAGAGTRPRMNGGRLGIVAALVRGAPDVARLTALEAVGQVGRFPGLLQWESHDFEVRSGAPVEVGLDGEALSMSPPLRFRTLPGALRVRIPVHAPGRSPAAEAVAMSATELRALARLAAGREEPPPPGGEHAAETAGVARV